MESPRSLLPTPDHVEIDGARIATYALGPVGDAQTVVLCHGTPWSAESWAPVASLLADEGMRVLLWDMPGYGRSSQDPALPVDLASQMRRLATLLSAWGLDRPHVVAHDVGGAVALGAHLLLGSEMSSLHLWDAVVLDPWGSPFFQLVADHGEVFDALPPRLHSALVREYIASATPAGLSPEWIARLAIPWEGRDGRRAFSRQIASLSPKDTRAVAGRLDSTRCPVTVGWGGRDPWLPPDQAPRLAKRLRTAAPATVLEGAGHLTPVERPESVAAHLLSHMA